MKISTETEKQARCRECGGVEFRPVGGDQFACRTCGAETTGKVQQANKEAEK